MVRKFKPAPETYQMAAATLNVSLENILFVAAHDWDVDGAKRVGCQTAFIARPGMVLGPLSEQHDYVGKDMAEVVAQVLSERHSSS
jgi:2-haloacid dehalogenase